MPWNIPLSYADTSNFLLHMQNINGSSSRDKLMAILNSCQLPSLKGFEEARARAPAMPKRPFYGMFDHHEDECSSDTHGLHHVEKKRRLTADQVRSLELSFEMENKLEPERKMKLAEQLGLQPRQVAVWFQNRRARWKTKELERVYDALKVDFDTVLAEKEKLQAEVKRLTAQLEATNNGRKGNDIFVKNETDIREGKTNEDNSEVERSQTVEQIDSLGEVNQQAILLESLNEFKDFSDENDKNGDVGSAADHDQQAGSVNNGSVDHYDHDNASPIEAPIPSDATFTAQDIYNLSFAPMLDVENEPYSLHYHESDWPTGVLDSWTWLIA